MRNEKKTFVRRFAVAMGALAFTSFLAPPANSASVPGASGFGWPKRVTCSSGSGTCANFCFESGWSDMENRCTTTQTLVIPLRIDTWDYNSFTARARGNGTTATTCKFVENDGNNAGWQGFVQSTSATNPAFQTLALGYQYIDVGNTAFVECQVAPPNGANEGSVVSVNFWLTYG